MSNRILIVFLKNPQLGKVKTRLAKTMGDTAALEAYRQLLATTLRQVAESGIAAQLWFSDFLPEETPEYASFYALLPENFSYEVRLQQGFDLGQRMSHAFGAVFSENPQAEAVIIGSDCPFITGEKLRHAFDVLETLDLVLGPTEDGGYYLLGMRAYRASLFEDIPWSTELVFEKTRAIAGRQGLHTAILPKLRDVDEEKDFIFWQSQP